MTHNPAAQLVFLIGMPAAGKTYWAAKLAKKYKLPFIDTDTYIATQEAASIPALFASYGESGFREREQKYLKKIIETTQGSAIISCGGGTPCYSDNIQLMKAAGLVIYISADVPLLLQHLQGSTEIRPLLNNKPNLATYLADLLQKRKPYYEQAHHILHAKDISLTTFAKISAYV